MWRVKCNTCSSTLKNFSPIFNAISGGINVKTFILEVREPSAVYGDFGRAWKSGAGPVSIREAARRVGRDVEAVHGDVTALINAGLLNRVEREGIEFPYDKVKVEFLLNAA